MEFISVKEKKPEENMSINFITPKNGVQWAGIYRNGKFYSVCKNTGSVIGSFVLAHKDSNWYGSEIKDVSKWAYIPNPYLVENVIIES
jgi:hypothetical protein